MAMATWLDCPQGRNEGHTVDGDIHQDLTIVLAYRTRFSAVGTYDVKKSRYQPDPGKLERTYRREGAKFAIGRILKPEALTLRLWNTASENNVHPLNLITGRPIWSRKKPATSTILVIRSSAYGMQVTRG
jgi:hypothetical protein